MSEAPSKRLRLRFFPEDERSVREILSGTKHSSQSNVIRSALALYEQVWSSKRMGFRIVYRQEETAECPDALDFPVRAMPGDGSGKRAKTERSIEIRVTPSDCERIESLIAMEAADTFSEVVRRAVRLYANVVARHKDGWELVAVSPSGDVLPLPVPGIGGVAKRPIATTLPLIPIRTAVVEPASLSALLPRSLDTIVNNLAAHEQCAADVLLVDMVRTEALARLRRLELGEPQPEPTAVEAELTQLVETMAVANTATAEKIPTEEQVSAATIETATSVPIPETPLAITEPPLAPISAQQDTYVIEQILTTLDMTSSLTEELVELVEEPAQPAQTMDLFASAATDETEVDETPPVALTTTPAEAALVRLTHLNSRLSTLMTLIQRNGRPKGKGKHASRSGNNGGSKTKEATGKEKTDTPALWPLGLAPDHPVDQQQLTSTRQLDENALFGEDQKC